MPQFQQNLDFEPNVNYLNDAIEGILNKDVLYERIIKINQLKEDFMKAMRKRKFIDEVTRELINNTKDYIHGVVYASDDYVELGWFKSSPDNIIVSIEGRYGGGRIPGISRAALPGLIWSNKRGCYIFAKNMPEREKMLHEKTYGQGEFPYLFPRHYEAAESFHLFENAQQVLNEVEYPLSKHLKYTFGLEFETSMGYVPQDLCFRDGLIPLRDGSISGIEYSSVVLEGNRGLNLLKQEVDTLAKYTKFNKECALHIHMGGYPVDPVAIYTLYSLWYLVERDLENNGYIPRYSFATAKYKANGKNSSKQLLLPVSFLQ